MAMNMDAILRIKASVSGISEIRQMQDSLNGIKTSASETTQELRRTREEAKSWRESALKITAVAASLTFAAKSAIDFESSMADVRKVVSGLDTPVGLSQIKKEILDLSSQMPITAEGFAQIYAAAGQSGIARNELREFALMVGKVSTAFDMTAEEAGTSLAQMKTALSLSNKEVESLADSMNYLSDNTGSSAANLVEFVARAGAAGKIAGLSGEETSAFGAAMIQAGVQTEVAATSFNIMLRALSAGTNMTERQTTALERLGYAFQPAVVATQDYTREAEVQSRNRLSVARNESDQRLAILRNETDKMSREIDRRYRQVKQQLEDQWEDERDARDEAMAQAGRQASKALQRDQERDQQALDDRYDASLKLELARFKGRTDALAEAEQDAIRKRYRDAKQQEMQALEDYYETKREDLDRAQREEQKLLRRADRDKQQRVIEGLQSRQEAEDEANKRRLKEAEKVENKQIERLEESENQKIEIVRQNQKDAEAAQKKQAEAAADAWKLSFAERLQKDGSGFLMEILGKISSLPKGEQLSVLTGLFGEEARGLAPLLGNLDELQRVLGLATDKTAAAGSVTREYETRAKTVANQMVLFTNSINQLKIAFGDALLPVINAVLPALTALFNGLASMTRGAQGLITFVAQLVGLKVVLSPVVALFGIIASTVGGIFSLIVLTRWTAALKILAFLPGPLRLVAAAFGILTVAASPLAPIINGIVLAITALQAIKFAGGILSAIPAITAAFTGLLAFLTGTIGPALIAFFSGPVGWTVLAVAAVAAMAAAFRKPIAAFLLWLPGEVKAGLDAAWQIAKQAFTTIGAGFDAYVAAPIRSAWTSVMEFIPNALTAAGNTIGGVWDGIINGIRGVFNGFLQGVAGGINSVARGINGLISQFNRLPGPDISFVPQLNVPQFATGGFVKRPTLAMIGEGGEPEYVVPQSKAASFANNIVAGRRGEQALRSWTDQMSIGALAPTRGFTSNLQQLAALRQQGIRASFSPMNGLLVQRREAQRATGSGAVAFGPRTANPLAGMGSTRVESLGRVEVKQNLRIDRVERRSDGDYVSLGAAEQLAAKASSDAVNQVVKLLQQPTFRRQVGIG